MNSITRSFSDGKALPRRQFREKWMGNGRPAPGSIEDKKRILRTEQEVTIFYKRLKILNRGKVGKIFFISIPVSK